MMDRRTTLNTKAPQRRRKISTVAAAAAATTVAATAALSSMASAGVEAFSASPLHLSHYHRRHVVNGRQPTTSSSTTTSRTTLHMTATAMGWDDNFFNNNNDDVNSGDELRRQQQQQQQQPQQQDGASSQYGTTNNNKNSKFVTGDALHRLRHQVLAMRLELQEARREGLDDRVGQLETTIMKTQQVDAEFVYTVSLERKALALQHEDYVEAHMWDERAQEARSALPQFQLEGLWVGRYGDMSDDDEDEEEDNSFEDDDYSTMNTNSVSQGYELINITYVGDVLMAHKVTAGKNVPKGAETFTVDLSPSASKISTAASSTSSSSSPDVLSPIELGDAAAEQWGCKYLQRFAGEGQVAAENFEDSQWVDGQLILVNEYFSFAWLPIGHQVFFGRPTPELILKLMKDDQQRETGGDGCETRAFLEKCWEETEHLEDDMDVSPDGIVVAKMDNNPVFSSSSSSSSPVLNNNNYYDDEDCFE
eukprot:CAMPEP_0113493068 /NCGR_PEP_ID=MMETSP0014_2-20120614/28401_1 /TAXON_ID=2857 /ORGANISM="Nitzschia sp." /LENGTH=477 /DNA_ID=CAMNT_0000386919 /DNA_START=330 /DNA_END=1763 /DNA_ORIENTATION=+ /assembly_acc=CAM_ASM_000159